jgi:hypothetical protein
MFEESVYRLLNKFDLGGKILSIRPGEKPVPCFGGVVSVSQEGEIQFKKRERVNKKL